MLRAPTRAYLKQMQLYDSRKQPCQQLSVIVIGVWLLLSRHATRLPSMAMQLCTAIWPPHASTS
jgi:hypothetical protein